MSEQVVFLTDVTAIRIRIDTKCGIWTELLLGKDDDEEEPKEE